ncbi:MAG TPA: Mrp/NBP35 family ATP-binding protein [Tenuifilaceae bacterium]|nr:Mrp/NBP35 family ATP-binding protein [Tenuifilaceae bacterium]HOZ14178.1 Mrp/NBP35 family ATP-binding protein [Tenuifilaceae bacterium]HPI43654.1 Mrp/NBP35 family ATP-binding protein [Tenuifilaceae bacterium]HPN21089.1 Mrp/NBP35 family ATP-binding protein [Tenuifilaceae bacterium]HPV56149.1 Mrp/NBP35 family ATP-binding protein [Tenuifilaceae bacterium]
MAIFEKIELEGVKNIVVVASGKGGVGKSTVSANLAISLARNGFKTALVDADIFGPSIPKMFGLENANPEVTHLGDKEMMFPVEKYGVKIMSIGFFIKKSQGLIWRGPMAANAIMQLFENTVWGDIDYMVVDFPPGTSDIQLTTVQKLKITGSIIVTTPQEVALNDARKAASMFNNPDLNVPIWGVVENMAWFTPQPHPDEKYYIFGQGGGEALAKELNCKLLGQIPLVAEVGQAAENGLSIYNQNNNKVIEAFEKLTETITA